MRWIEINVGLKYDKPFLNEVLVSQIKPIVEQNQARICSWHFLWEGKPWPVPREIGTTLRLRFFGEESTIATLRNDLDTKFLSLEKQSPDLYLGHCFGKHGKCEQEYDGEAEDWGIEGWKLGIGMLGFASDTALKLIEDQDKLGRTRDYRWGINFYADRYVHLFLNMIETIPSFDEADFLLSRGCQRTSLKSIGKPLLQEELNRIKQLVKREIQSLRT